MPQTCGSRGSVRTKWDAKSQGDWALEASHNSREELPSFLHWLHSWPTALLHQQLRELVLVVPGVCVNKQFRATGSNPMAILRCVAEDGGRRDDCGAHLPNFTFDDDVPQQRTAGNTEGPTPKYA